jgi:hypothetical protein
LPPPGSPKDAKTATDKMVKSMSISPVKDLTKAGRSSHAGIRLAGARCVHRGEPG